MPETLRLVSGGTERVMNLGKLLFYPIISLFNGWGLVLFPSIID